MDNELQRCKPWIEAALEYSGGTHEWEDIVEGLQKGVLQLWPTPRGCIVTEIVVYPGGELDQILDMHDDVIEWAKAQGCSALTMSGRFGWKKPLKAHGWKAQHAAYIKEFG